MQRLLHVNHVWQQSPSGLTTFFCHHACCEEAGLHALLLLEEQSLHDVATAILAANTVRCNMCSLLSKGLLLARSYTPLHVLVEQHMFDDSLPCHLCLQASVFGCLQSGCLE